MSVQYPTTAFVTEVAIEAPERDSTDRTFGLPTSLYVVTVGSYLAFLGVMAVGFQSRDMVLPMVIFVAYIVMLFGVPMLWARMKPDNDSRALGWGDFMHHGVDTWTGRTSGAEATLQVLILPVLVLLWGLAVVTIAALV